MKTINVYEVGVDDPPAIGLEICYWERSYSFNFVDDQLKFGTVGVCCKPGEEDRDDFNYEEIDWGDYEGEGKLFDDLGYPHVPHLYIDEVETQLKKGDRWAYYHEYNEAIGADDVFPFQEAETLDAAIKHGLVEELSRTVDVIKKGSLTFSGVARPECDLYYTDIKVWYNGEKYLLKFSSTRPDVLEGRLFEYNSIDEGLDYV